MSYLILFFGVLILLSGAMILLNPDPVFGLFRRHGESSGFHVMAVVVRLILGIALVRYAAESKYPLALQILGWLSLVAAMVLAVMGRTRFKRLLTWALSFTSPLARIAGFFGMVFGGFLIYAVV